MNPAPDDFFDLARKYLPEWAPKLVFDVGAHVGETVRHFAQNFPEAKILAFEPTPETYRELVRATSGLPNVVTHNLALGRTTASLGMLVRGTSTSNHLLPLASQDIEKAIKVQVRSGAEVFRELGASRIDILKIDTEGHDYDVLIGFLPVIQQVDFIQVEAAMNPYNRTHVPLRLFEDLLWHHGFHLFHVLEQTMEWKRGGRPVLRRANPVFINGRLLDLEKIR